MSFYARHCGPQLRINKGNDITCKLEGGYDKKYAHSNKIDSYQVIEYGGKTNISMPKMRLRIPSISPLSERSPNMPSFYLNIAFLT
jgi:hypothetical protein